MPAIAGESRIRTRSGLRRPRSGLRRPRKASSRSRHVGRRARTDRRIGSAPSVVAFRAGAIRRGHSYDRPRCNAHGTSRACRTRASESRCAILIVARRSFEHLVIRLLFTGAGTSSDRGPFGRFLFPSPTAVDCDCATSNNASARASLSQPEDTKSEEHMRQLSLHRKLALAAALVSALSLTGAAMAASPHPSSHASPTAVTHVAANTTGTNANDNGGSDHGTAVSAAAQSALTGGPQNNHGGYVSCIARGGSNCTEAAQTLPGHGQSSTHSHAAAHTP